MAITGIIGLPGEGKTIWATIMLLRKMRRMEEQGIPHRFAANYPVTCKAVEFVPTWKQAQDLYDCTYVLDECPQYFGRRNVELNTEDDLQYWRQHRKDGLTLIWTAHDVNDIDRKIAAELTAVIYVIKRLFGPDDDGGPTPIEKKIGVWSVVLKYKAKEAIGTAGFKASARPCAIPKFIRLDKHYGIFDSFHVVTGRDTAGREGKRRKWTRQEVEELAVVDHPLLAAEVYHASRRLPRLPYDTPLSRPLDSVPYLSVDIAALNRERSKRFKKEPNL